MKDYFQEIKLEFEINYDLLTFIHVEIDFY